MTIYYRTKDAKADFGFDFEQQNDGTWRAYIVQQPSYQGRAEDAHATHRLTHSSRKYVCWTHPLPTLEAAKSVSALWADETQKYIRTGSAFN